MVRPMNPSEGDWWRHCQDMDESVSCVGCGDLVHKDAAWQSMNDDDEWMCQECVDWHLK